MARFFCYYKVHAVRQRCVLVDGSLGNGVIYRYRGANKTKGLSLNQALFFCHIFYFFA